MAGKSPEQRSEIARKAHATRRARKLESQLRRNDDLSYQSGLRQEIYALEARLSELRALESASIVSAALTGKSLLAKDEIAKSALPWEKSSGVYFLLHDDEIVYVGQSVHIYSRIAGHADKKFNRYAYIPCPPEALDVLESLYIHLLRPALNGERCDGFKAAPMMLDKILGLATNKAGKP